MNARSILLLMALAVSAPALVHGQTVYHLKYKSPLAGDTTTCSAYFISSGNGSGLVRLKKDGATDIAEMEVLEQFVTDKDGLPDTTLVFYEPLNIKNVNTRNKKVPAPVTFWFKMTAANLYEPWAVTEKTSVPVPVSGNFLAADLLKNEDLTRNKPLVLSYFDTATYYYKNLFVKNSGNKGGTGVDPKKTRMFLLVVASTRDSSLMPNCLIDARRVVDMFTDIAENELGIGLFVDSVYGSRYNKAAVETAIARLKPGSNDIVVFYYSGHGFTQKKRVDKQFPFLDLRDPNKRPRPEASTQTLNIQDIYTSIVSKKARLNLVISDCCNDTIEAKKPKSIVPPPITKGPVKYSLANMNALFLAKMPMSYLVTAASRDERAIITPRYSSYFTYFFIESLRAFLSPVKGNPSWLQVMEDAKKQTTLFAGKVPCPNGRKCVQNPKMLVPK
ncbi:MAG: caspase family protein [Chitinophagaceae bacterium]